MTRRHTQDAAVGGPGPRPGAEDLGSSGRRPLHSAAGGTLVHVVMAYVHADDNQGCLDPFALLDAAAVRMGASEQERRSARSVLQSLSALRSLVSAGRLSRHLGELINARSVGGSHAGLVIHREFRCLEA